MKSRIPIFATFLPQFHQDINNDRWWGYGFTEWDNVRRAKPLFKGHMQPKYPVNGYFDLAKIGEIERQFKMARKYGISSFMIYHYWSDGTRLLSKPLDEILDHPDADIEFSLCWANHPWSRTWRNRTGALDILLPQSYSDLSAHADFLCTVFNDKRYSKVDNRPILTIYKPSDLPSVKSWVGDFRRIIKSKLGVTPYLIAMVKSGADIKAAQNFDAINIFQPSGSLFGAIDLFDTKTIKTSAKIRAAPALLKKLLYAIQDLMPAKPRLFDYKTHSKHCLQQYIRTSDKSNLPVIPMVCAGFDNTPRYKSRATILTGFSENIFSELLHETIAHSERLRTALSPSAPPFIVINSWNEWGEGMFLQPDEQYGLRKLEVINEVARIVE